MGKVENTGDGGVKACFDIATVSSTGKQKKLEGLKNKYLVRFNELWDNTQE